MLIILLNRLTPFRPYLTRVVILLTLMSTGCDNPPTPLHQQSQDSRTETLLVSADFRTQPNELFIFNTPELISKYASRPSVLWQSSTDESMSVESIELLPSGANESVLNRGNLMSYGRFLASGLEDYHRVAIALSVDGSKISPNYSPEPNSGCDLFVETQYWINNEKLENDATACLLPTGSISHSIPTLGADSTLVELYIEFPQFRRGILGYTDSRLPLTGYSIRGYRYENSPLSGKYQFDGLDYVQSEQCSYLEQFEGEVEINLEGTQAAGTITKDADTLTLTASRGAGSSTTMKGSLYQNDALLGDITIRFDRFQGFRVELPETLGCYEQLWFVLNESYKGSRVTNDILFHSDATQNTIPDPLVRLTQPTYSPPSYESGQGINLLPGGYQEGTSGFINAIVSPVYRKNGSDRISVSLGFSDSHSLVGDTVRLNYFVNYGFGWVPVNESGSIHDTRNHFEMLYSPHSETLQFAVALVGHTPKPWQSDASLYLTDVTLNNISENNWEELPSGYFDVRSMSLFEDCESETHLVHYKLDIEHSRLIISTDEGLNDVWVLDNNLNVDAEYQYGGQRIHLTGNLNSHSGMISQGDCSAPWFHY